ncbi:MAG: hypothetical protein J6T38_09795, partial [Bacteroidaceae bacterium]|nr:hypothetical protein [Bacteroidaceae bacterium]
SREAGLANAISWSIKDGVLNISARDLEALEQANGTVDVIISAPGSINYEIGNSMQESSSTKHRARFSFRRHRR